MDNYSEECNNYVLVVERYYVVNDNVAMGVARCIRWCPRIVSIVSYSAVASSLQLKNAEFQEMIIHHSRRKKRLTYYNEIPGIKRVDTLNILGVIISHTLTFHNHVDVVVEMTIKTI